MSQLPDIRPKEGEELYAAVTDNKHNKTHVSKYTTHYLPTYLPT